MDPLNPNRIWQLAARKLSHEATPEELAEFEHLLLCNPDVSFSMEVLHELWNSRTKHDSRLAENQYKELLHKMQRSDFGDERFSGDENYFEATSSPAKKRKHWIFWSATTVIIALAIFLLFRPGTIDEKQERIAVNEIRTAIGSKTNFVLPDGTKVWLNAGSKLTYAKDFGKANRQVNLEGEGFFDVVKNEAMPFRVQTQSVIIKVIGTAFNVRSYPGESETETSLVRGKLEVSRPGSNEAIIMKPNEKLVLKQGITKIKGTDIKKEKSTGIIELTRVTLMSDSSIVETAWVNNRLVFRSELFEEVALKMERWFAVNIHFMDEPLKKKRLTGIFENESIGEALAAIQLTTAFDFNITDNQVTISKPNK